MLESVSLYFGLVTDVIAITSFSIALIMIILYCISLYVKGQVKKQLMSFINSFEVNIHGAKKQISFNSQKNMDELQNKFFRLVHSFYPDLLLITQTQRKHTKISINEIEDLTASKAFFKIIKQYRSIEEFKKEINLNWINKQKIINDKVIQKLGDAITTFDKQFKLSSSLHYITDFSTYFKWEIKVEDSENKYMYSIFLDNSLNVIENINDNETMTNNFMKILKAK
ncbi:MAG: hypothetical protein ACRC42_04210 [Mycoplasma sp.]